MAGPGHKPEIPHPNPKQIAPTISFESISVFLGLNNSLPLNDLPLKLKRVYLFFSI
jgi:hypothetical protein